jgi:serine/threonine-protein kinase RsbW
MASDREPTTGDDDHFEVIVPLRTRYASTVRMIAASLGAEAGFTVDEIDDLRLALDEVFSLLAERHVGDRVRTRFRLDGHQLIAGLTLESGEVDVKPDELAANILRSVVDRYEFSTTGVTLTKRASNSE